MSSSKVVDKLEVVCLPEKQSKLPVKIYLDKKNIPVATWPSLPNTKFDIGVVVSFGKLIPKSVIESFKYGMINVHGSLLPRWRGASPIAHTILAGDETAGISIMEIKPKRFDHGRILTLSKAIPVKPTWTAEDLEIALEDSASSCLLMCLQDVEYYLKNAKTQDKNLVTYAPKILPKHSVISWDVQTVDEICCQYRAFGFKKDYILRTTFRGDPIKLQRITHLTEEQLSRLSVHMDSPPGTVLFDKVSRTLCVGCKDSFIGVTRIIYAKPLQAQDFYNGSMQVRLKRGETIKFE